MVMRGKPSFVRAQFGRNERYSCATNLKSAKFQSMQPGKMDHISIRDSIHGSIWVNPNELKLIDHPAIQRLRFIKQVGFIDLAFPGANHSRYAHSLGAMHMATRIFDTLFLHNEDLDSHTKTLFRQSLRLAALTHDIGHGPLSHSSEALMPKVAKLGNKGVYVAKDLDRQANHEDYTLKLLIESSFSHLLEKLFSDAGVTKEHVAGLIFREFDSLLFMHKGINYRPILQQIVSSECDADRMDYLQRDSVYCGVNFGKFDVDWLVENLVPVQMENELYLGLRSRAIFSFEDFLLSRYHMFASVYLHHTPVIFDRMLELHSTESTNGFTLPADIEEYIQVDDIELWTHLRHSVCPWAKRIVERRPFYLLDEYKIDSPNENKGLDHAELESDLCAGGIPTIRCYSKSLLSKYFQRESNSIFVTTNSGEIVPLETYTPLYQRYKTPAQLHRLFVSPDYKDQASIILRESIQRARNEKS